MRKSKGKIREKYVYDIISQFQEDQHLVNYPLDPIEIAQKNDWVIISYTDFHTEMIEISEDGFSYYYDGKFYIYYNNMKPKNRIRFTLFHEIGHIILNHHIEFKKEILNISGNNTFMESEANIVARNLMAPAHIIRNLYPEANTLLHEIFKMSDEAAINRLKWVNKDYKEITYKNSNFLYSEIKRLNIFFEYHSTKILWQKIKCLY